MPGVTGLLSWLVGATGSLISAVISIVAIPLFIIYYLLEEPETVQNFRRKLPGLWTEDMATHRDAVWSSRKSLLPRYSPMRTSQ